MIISDEDDALKIKDPPVAAPTVRCPERAASRRPFSPLPDYETSQALAFRDFNESQVTLYKPPPRRRIFDSRLWRAVITALVVYIFLTLVIGIPIILHKDHDNEPKFPYSPFSYASWPPKNSDSDYLGNVKNMTSPVQPGVSPVCDEWTSVVAFEGPTIIASTERHVSPNGQFSFASNASCSGDLYNAQGDFYVGINPNQTVQDAVLSVVMLAPSLNLSSACLAVADNFTDLLLYLPDDSSASQVLYNISLLFPQSATPSQVDSFATILPMFDQRFSSFDDSVNFQKVSIAGAASRVTVDSIHAHRLLIDTSLEPVAGTFHVDNSLLISTVLAPIVANISLYNDPNSQFPTTLDVHTGNSNLTANVTVASPNKGPPLRPNFIANLRTFSGLLSTSFLHDPSSPPTAIQLHAFNDLGPANVTLDSLFEGIFQASTKEATATVTQGNANGTDPWGQGQPRNIEMDVNVTSRSYGWVGWGNMETPNSYQQGEVIVQSSLADVMLLFLG